MIFWSGLGVFVPVTLLIFSLIANFVTDINTGGSSDYWNTHKWPLGVAVILSAVVCLLINELVIKKEKTKVLIDKESGKDVVLKKRHTFFFIPIQYWAPIFAILGAALILKDFIHI